MGRNGRAGERREGGKGKRMDGEGRNGEGRGRVVPQAKAWPPELFYWRRRWSVRTSFDTYFAARDILVLGRRISVKPTTINRHVGIEEKVFKVIGQRSRS